MIRDLAIQPAGDERVDRILGLVAAVRADDSLAVRNVVSEIIAAASGQPNAVILGDGVLASLVFFVENPLERLGIGHSPVVARIPTASSGTARLPVNRIGAFSLCELRMIQTRLLVCDSSHSKPITQTM